MADNSNPFYIQPPNVLQALMLGKQAFGEAQDYQKQRYVDQAAEALARNDLTTATSLLAKGGKLEPALALRRLMAQEQLGADFNQTLGGIFGPQAAATPAQPQRMASNAPAQQPSAPVGAPTAPMQTTNLTDPGTTITGTDYGPVTRGNQVVAQGAGYVPEPAAAPRQAIAPSPSVGANIRGTPLSDAVPQLLKLALHPLADKGQQETARMLLGKAIDQYPTEIRQLEIFRQNPQLYQMALEMKRAGATSINTAEGMDAATTKARLTADTDAAKQLQQQALQGAKLKPLLEQAIKLATATPGGWAGQASATLAKAASAFGIPVTEGMSNAELLGSINRQLIPGVRDPGSTANYEQQLYQAAVIGLSQSQEGRVKIGRMMQAQIQRTMDLAKVFRENIGKPDLYEKLAELDNKPMFNKDDAEAARVAATQGQPAQTGTSTTQTGVPWRFVQ